MNSTSQPALIDPRELTPTERKLLREVATYKFYRRRNGWAIPGQGNKVSLKSVDNLYRKHLISDRSDCLRLTGAGQMVLAVMQERERAKTERKAAQ
ncbi:hypothetical protein GJU94_08060 [Brucella sp. 10RB9214]|uniref:hypothetical protein n=1 Tax=unclassified Brucella TaxID=2632610 RepID=UPI000972E45B|nr:MULTISPECIES: hypothetical protein [unclassified Brucella]APY13189.1 hypothetical protein BKD02_01710 [Brucella sp. 09RB8910]MRN46152.1 hypothetical protein [Brucella sp. 10RB9212]MRN49786.1 hypothetical protein [Brucella sp. 10RB9214]